MLRSLSLALVLSAALGSPFAQAAAIQYDFNFTGNGLLPTSGSFTYDDAIPLFTSFLVTWNGTLFDLTAQANSPLIQGPSPACLNGATGAAASFIMLSNGCPANETSWNALEMEGLQFFSFQFDATNDVNGIYVERNIYGSGLPPTTGANGTWTLSPNLDLDIDPVPEPSTFIPVALTGLFLLGKRLKRQTH